MVEYTAHLDTTFHALADATRRDILHRVTVAEQSISSLAERYGMSFSAVAKHLRVLETACLITKRRSGRERLVSANLHTIKAATTHLEAYMARIEDRHKHLDALLAGERRM